MGGSVAEWLAQKDLDSNRSSDAVGSSRLLCLLSLSRCRSLSVIPLKMTFLDFQVK